MLKRMKAKDDYCEYTFGECCLFILMIIGAALSFYGLLAACVLAIVTSSFSPLIWLMPCGVIAVVCCAGLMYVQEGCEDGDEF